MRAQPAREPLLRPGNAIKGSLPPDSGNRVSHLLLIRFFRRRRCLFLFFGLLLRRNGHTGLFLWRLNLCLGLRF